MGKKEIIICIHIYYEASWKNLISPALKQLDIEYFDLMVNICSEMKGHEEIISWIKSEYPEAIILKSPNQGKDIGGKLAMLGTYLALNLNCAYLIFLHDKISPQAITGDIWRETLYKIISRNNFLKIYQLLETNNEICVVGAKEFILHEYDLDSGIILGNNGKFITRLMEKYALKIHNHEFVGGTMFWVRAKAFIPFFKKYDPIFCREDLEKGNILDIELGSFTHAWERLFCWIATSNGNRIKGI